MPVKENPNKTRQNTRPNTRPKPKKKKASLLGLIIGLLLLGGIGALFVPQSFKMFSSTFFPDKITVTSDDNVICSNSFKSTGGVNLSELINPTLGYTSNYTFLNNRMDYSPSQKRPEMEKLTYGDRLVSLENSLKALNQKYSNIKPSIFVMSMDNNNYASVDSDKIYPSASIIKLPVLIQMYKAIEAEQFGLKDMMYLTEYYRSSGSGNMQYHQAGRAYSVYDLAKVMIQDSDNTATNMLMSKIGSMNDINATLRNWGIKHTHVQTWLPDLTGTNYTTAEDMAQMLYNIGNDDNKFLNINSQSDIINIMGKVKNVNLIKAGLPSSVDFIHKTGDIGTMLGDAGIVYLPSGQRYIVVILALRPHNNPNGKLFIQEASKIIYNYMSTQN
jgi:beta-lactamase class A